MIDHVTFGVSNFAQSCDFYDVAFAPSGIRRLTTFREAADVAGYGDDRPWFWIAEQDATRGKPHIAIRADSRAMVDAFYAAALMAGGRDHGAPGLRGSGLITTRTIMRRSCLTRTDTTSRRFATAPTDAKLPRQLLVR